MGTKPKLTPHEQADALRESLMSLNEGTVPVVSRNERMTFKDRAKAARQLFRELGLKGISVRQPRGVNCLWVEVLYPRSTDNETNCKNRLALEEILQRAFPKEIDHSDRETDYFKPAWTFFAQ
jgi:hypothetical protein